MQYSTLCPIGILSVVIYSPKCFYVLKRDEPKQSDEYDSDLHIYSSYSSIFYWANKYTVLTLAIFWQIVKIQWPIKIFYIFFFLISRLHLKKDEMLIITQFCFGINIYFYIDNLHTLIWDIDGHITSKTVLSLNNFKEWGANDWTLCWTYWSVTGHLT